MKGLDEIIEEFKNSEESKALDKVNEATKKLLSRKEVMDAMAEAVAETIEACFEEKNKEIATIRTGFETYKLIEKLFREEEPAEKTELSALKELLFERTHLAKGEVQRSLLRYTVWQTFRGTRPDQKCGLARRIRRLEGGEGL